MTGAGYLAVDSGGSGLRAVVGAPGRGPLARAASDVPVRTGGRGLDPVHFMEQLVPMARALCAEAGLEQVDTAAIGAAGMASLGDALRAELPDGLARELGVTRAALAADAVTAYVGALGPRPGAVIAAGTGLIAIGTDLSCWRRADGWGHLLGDCGGGAWMGRAGLEAALRAHDGRDGGSVRLLADAEEMFGPVTGLPGQVYPRADRAAVLASFAPRVGACAEDGDPVALDIVRTAARHMAGSAAAVCPAEGAPAVGCTGGLFGLGEVLLAPLDERLAELLPGARRVPAEGGPLDGAVRLAEDLSAGPLALPGDERMLCVTSTGGTDITLTADTRT